MKKFYDLSEQRRLDIYNQVSNLTGLPPAAIEKDWWVTLTLKAIFSLSFADHIVFKGGTSISKGWNLIERFSEDIDLVLDRTFIGFSGELSKGEIRRLRKASCNFISNDFPKQLEHVLQDIGISKFELSVKEYDASDTDPVEVQLNYGSITEKSDYLLPRVLIEVGSRSLIEPVTERPIQSILSETFPTQKFTDSPVNIPIVLPKRTFLEKAFLLHEEFQRPLEKMILERKSRHLYDLEKMMDTTHGIGALKDVDLYRSIVEHREKYAHLSEVDYSTHSPDKINFIPPDELIKKFDADYADMQENMIYGESLPFYKLIERLKELQNRFRNIS